MAFNYFLKRKLLPEQPINKEEVLKLVENDLSIGIFERVKWNEMEVARWEEKTKGTPFK